MRPLSDFKPPKPNPALIALCRLLLPAYLNWGERLSVSFAPRPEELLASLKGKPVAIFFNHPDRHDPQVAVALARHFQDPCFCVVAREVFDWDNGSRGWFLQSLGGYSVNRGSADLRSLKTTKKILAQHRHKLVIFPEAEITADNYVVHDFQKSVMHLLLDAQQCLANQDPEASILILPVAVSYRLETSLESSLDKTLRKIESKLGIIAGKGDVRKRSESAVQTLLQRLSGEIGFTTDETLTPEQFVTALAEHICHKVIAYAAVTLDSDLSPEARLHGLRHAIARKIDSHKSSSNYQRALWREECALYRKFVRDLDRVERFLIFERVLSQPTSPIQVCRIVDFLESETMGRMTAKGRQSVFACIGAPIAVQPQLKLYKTNKEAAIAELTNRTKQGLQSALDISLKIAAGKNQQAALIDQGQLAAAEPIHSSKRYPDRF